MRTGGESEGIAANGFKKYAANGPKEALLICTKRVE
jgi:hypothetical protein